MNDSSTNIQLNSLIIDSRNLLTELERSYETKRRQIENSFQTLYDNIPKELKNLPIKMTIENYLKTVTKQAFNTIDVLDAESTDDQEEFDDEKEKFKKIHFKIIF